MLASSAVITLSRFGPSHLRESGVGGPRTCLTPQSRPRVSGHAARWVRKTHTTSPINGRRAGQLEEVRFTDIEHIEFDL